MKVKRCGAMIELSNEEFIALTQLLGKMSVNKYAEFGLTKEQGESLWKMHDHLSSELDKIDK